MEDSSVVEVAATGPVELQTPTVPDIVDSQLWLKTRQNIAEAGPIDMPVGNLDLTQLIDDVIDSIVSPQTTNQPIQDIIKKAAVVLGYSGGNSWPTFRPFETARPDLVSEHRVIPVTLSCVDFGHMYDIEPGGGQNQNIGVFMHNARNVWKTQDVWGPQWLYTFASNVEAMVAEAAKFGYKQDTDYYVLAAHPNSSHGKHICAPNVCGYPKVGGTQYLFAGSYDESIISAYMIHKVPPPPPDDFNPAFREAYNALWTLAKKYPSARGRLGLKEGAGAMERKL